MSNPWRCAPLVFAAVLGAAGAGAATLEQDEAKIDAIIRAEHAAREAAAQSAPATQDARTAAPVVASVIAPPSVQPAGREWLSAPSGDPGLSFGDLAQNIGKIVVITTAGERVHRGVVKSADARQVTLQVKRAGGNATYALRREQVLHIDLR